VHSSPALVTGPGVHATGMEQNCAALELDDGHDDSHADHGPRITSAKVAIGGVVHAVSVDSRAAQNGHHFASLLGRRERVLVVCTRFDGGEWPLMLAGVSMVAALAGMEVLRVGGVLCTAQGEGGRVMGTWGA
jgi:hypothetical protein